MNKAGKNILTIRKSQVNYKIITFLESIRKLSSQGKQIPRIAHPWVDPSMEKWDMGMVSYVTENKKTPGYHTGG